MVTTPAIPRIKAGSSYSDEMVSDVAVSKYCDLIPIERYTQMATREGVQGLPANTLIQSTHNLADFLTPVYEKIRDNILKNAMEAVKTSFENHFLPAMQDFKIHPWRVDRYYNEFVDNFIKAHMPILEGLYKSWAPRKDPGRRE